MIKRRRNRPEGRFCLSVRIRLQSAESVVIWRDHYYNDDNEISEGGLNSSMKKTMILLLAAVLLVGCAGCTGQPAGGGQTASTPTPAPSPTAEPDLIQLTEPDPQDEPDPQPLTEPDPASESEPLPFVHMEFCSAGMTVGETVIEVTKTQKGAALSKYTRWTYWDSDKQEEIEEKQIIREMEAGQDMYDQIAAEAGKYGAASWDGFSESDPNVLDGETFRFEAELEDGTMLIDMFSPQREDFLD